MNWIQNKPAIKQVFWVIIVFGIIGRLLVVPCGVYTSDMKLWVDWGQTLVSKSFSEYFTAGWSDRLPGGILYMLWLMAALQRAWPDLSNELVYKLPANIADVVLAYLLFRLVGKKWGEEKGLLTALLYFFNPFVWHITALWGQMDSVQALLLVLILLALFRNWWGVMTGLLVYAFQFKPHSIFIVPLILLYCWQTRINERDFIGRCFKILAIALGIIWVLSVPFVPSNNLAGTDLSKLSSPWELNWQQLMGAKDGYPYASVNAFNLWGLFKTNWDPDNQTLIGLTWEQWGTALFSIAVLVILFALGRGKKKPVFEEYGFALGLIYLSGFTFLTRVHERYILPVFFFYLLAVWSRSYRLKIYLLLTVLAVMNSWFAYGLTVGDPWTKSNSNMASLLSLLVVLVILFEFRKLFGERRG